ncbi:MAG: cyanoexosortase A [Oscillatoriophycideae cyanobacterium NC_groundwater_1537_Pr4_S-0.65um_50_18]|nr:cyanoexosortase A [Oscillatoriophycideae cyanobacterium NC_groundwater_1537_Pr4_S-0.65um_50_18]
MVSIESLKSPRFLLFGLGGAIAAIHLTLTATVDHFPLFSNGLLLWTGVGILLWSRRYDLPLGGSLGGRWGSKLCGILLLGWGLLNSVVVKPSDLFLHLFPVTAALGVVLIASGFSGLKHYRGELLVLAFLALVPEAVAKVVDISILTAQYATHLLQWTGFEAIRQGVIILLPAGGIEVADTCSGMSVILHLLGIAVLVVQLFPTGWRLRAAILAAAIALGFAINGVRVAVLAALSGAEDPQAFKYWHIGDGSHFFSVAALLAFGLICYGLMGRQKILD